MSDTTEIRELAAVVCRAWKPVLFAAAVCAYAGYMLVGFVIPPRYTASALLQVDSMPQSPVADSSALAASRQLAASCAILLQENNALEALAESCAPAGPGPDALRCALTVRPVGETGLLRVRATLRDPALAANAAENLAKLAPGLLRPVLKSGTVTVVNPAAVPLKPDGPTPGTAGIASGVCGGAGIFLLFLLREQLSDRIRGENALYSLPGVCPLGVWRPGEGRARGVCERLMLAVDREDCRVLAFSEIEDGYAAALVLAFARALARGSSHVLLLDADFRRSRLRKLLEQERRPGLSDLLAGRCALDDCILPEVRPLLDLMPAGEQPEEVFRLPGMPGSPVLETLFGALRARYDYLILACPPFGPEALAFARHTDGMVLSVGTGASLHALRAAAEDLRRIETRLLGAALLRRGAA